MKLQQLNHDGPVKAGCCNVRVHTTYVIAPTKQQALNEIEKEAPDNREPCGMCGNCMAAFISEQGLPNDVTYLLEKADKTDSEHQ